ncbi:heavy metal translocating P-type ATPase [Caldisalinibacter kiritimatiensis]|uniref:Lead, cadmium, zinc and mercury transporting ATPase / Copper-translocating P-type ATPase n=1 Tax=Caldisalinibacter kiritimatiensis TaxID=1304284 RepID=R1CSI5_9FIRM|nr:heavy metal translocating P-type ATPase [Caldisalinibacter kiritimatiensis]EOC99668.1 Lead, cadmium, zinc and mercury transporting ATPase / Copper-translocating P-type ATPase [Caldisalinibacter kiritimatiensis]
MSSNIRKEYILDGLICASCAQKIENKISNLNHVKKVNINFATGKLTIEVYDNKTLDIITKKAKGIIREIEPNVKVIETNKSYEFKNNFENNLFNLKIFILDIIGILIFLIATFANLTSPVELTLYLTSYLLIGRKVLSNAYRNILKKQLFDENFLMTLATIGAFIIKEFPEAIMVMLFYQIGEYLQGLAVNNSKKSIKSLLNLRPDYVNLKLNDKIKQVSPEKVNIGDIIVIKPGEKIPLDGVIIDGESFVDTSMLTGESVPRKVRNGDEILSGFINTNSILTIKVTKNYEQSTAQKIIELVENASSKKAPTERFITRFSRYYTPIVVLLALTIAFLPPLLVKEATFSNWLYRSLIFLVVSCPCGLVLSVPLGFFGGIGSASKNGILVKGGNYLEALNDVEIAVFDKTGTLTKGVFEVSKIKPDGNITKEQLLELAAYAESYSNHPIAKSIIKSYGLSIDQTKIQKYNEIPGHGIISVIQNTKIAIGNAKLMKKQSVKYKNVNEIGTIVHIALDDKYAGYIVVADAIKEDSFKALNKLKSLGIKKNVMLTGDNKSTAIKVKEKLNIDEVYYELLPDEKVEKLEALYNQKSPHKRLMFIGDGINDAPVIARADIGLAMGGLGSDAAIEVADIVIMTDEPSKIVTAIKIARKTKTIVWQNIIFALTIKIAVLLLGTIGMASMWQAIFADVGVALLAVVNAMRILRFKK